MGNDVYQHFPQASLPGCANDVKLIMQMLVQVFGFAAEDVRP